MITSSSWPGDELVGKVVIVTGSSRGLGRAIAKGFARAGALVVVSSRKAEACADVVAEIRSEGGTALGIPCHVGDWEACRVLVEATMGEFGRLDVLVNNAGIAPAPPSLEGLTEELVDKTLSVDLKGPLRLMSLAAAHLPSGGSIINISSKASVRPSPMTAVYAAAKAGLNVLTSAAAQELGPRGVRVNALVCGPFRSDSFDRSVPTSELMEMVAQSIALRRIASPEEVVGAALFLATSASSYVNGSLLAIDGGGM